MTGHHKKLKSLHIVYKNDQILKLVLLVSPCPISTQKRANVFQERHPKRTCKRTTTHYQLILSCFLFHKKNHFVNHPSCLLLPFYFHTQKIRWKERREREIHHFYPLASFVILPFSLFCNGVIYNNNAVCLHDLKHFIWGK